VQILAITTARIACIDGDLSAAEGLLTQDINSYAHHSFIMIQKHEWDRALQDAINVGFTDSSCPPLRKANSTVT
jgi:hypothetical protein